MSRFKPSAIPTALRPTPAAFQPASPVAIPQAVPGPRVVALENPLHKIGFLLTLVYVVILTAYLNELVILAAGISPNLTIFLGPPAFLLALLSGRLRQVFEHRIAFFLLALVALYTLAIPFSEVKTQSLRLVTIQVSANYAVFLMIGTMVFTLKQCRWIMYAIALSVILDIVTIFAFRRAGDRLEAQSGSLGNANDLAAHLLSILPFCAYVAMEKGRNWIVRLLMIVAGLVVLYACILTGSRSAVLSIAVIGLFAFWKASPGHRLLIGVATVVAIPLLPIISPQGWQRVITLFSDRAAYYSDASRSAVESKEQRLHLLMRSIEVTLQHPLLGAGPGEFMDAEASLAKEDGMRAAWQVTHNTYTQISSEAGIPALLCFLGVLFGSVSMNLRLYNRTRRHPELRQVSWMAFCLLVSTASVAVSMTFASWAYTYYTPLLAGLTLALWNASQDQLKEAGV